jgi:hypothetical protein
MLIVPSLTDFIKELDKRIDVEIGKTEYHDKSREEIKSLITKVMIDHYFPNGDVSK